jgi:hypothetical protein
MHEMAGLGVFPINCLGACLTPSPRFPLHVHRQEEVESVHPMTLEEVFQRVEVRFGSNRSIHPLLGQ